MPFIAQGKTNLKYILIVVVLAVIVGGVILGYYYLWIKDLEAKLTELEIRLPEKVTKNETADWKTYRNEEYEFELKYPSGYSLKILEYKNTPCFRDLNIPGPIELCTFTITTHSLNGKTLEKRIEEIFAKPPEFIVTEWRKIGERNWFFLHDLEGPGPGTFHLFVKDKNIVVDVFSSRVNFNEPEILEIISTFRFLE